MEQVIPDEEGLVHTYKVHGPDFSFPACAVCEVD